MNVVKKTEGKGGRKAIRFCKLQQHKGKTK